MVTPTANRLVATPGEPGTPPEIPTPPAGRTGFVPHQLPTGNRTKLWWSGAFIHSQTIYVQTW